MNRSRAAGSGGFTLIEVMITLVILEVAVLGVAGFLVLASQTLERARSLELALAAAAPIGDSLVRADSIVTGAASSGGLELRWTGAGSDAVIHVTRDASDTVAAIHFSHANR